MTKVNDPFDMSESENDIGSLSAENKEAALSGVGGSGDKDNANPESSESTENAIEAAAAEVSAEAAEAAAKEASSEAIDNTSAGKDTCSSDVETSPAECKVSIDAGQDSAKGADASPSEGRIGISNKLSLFFYNLSTFFQKIFHAKKAPSEKPLKKKLSRKGAIILFSVLGAVLIAAVIFGIYLNNIISNPHVFFDDIASSAEEPAPTEEAPAIEPAHEEELPEDGAVEEEESEYDKMLSAADKSLMDGIVNIALVGVDHAEERDSEEWNGKTAFHADVILILAINFNENTVDMISIPRDTYAKIPDVKGIYKINASLDLGGGMYDENGNGFKKVCETAEWMLGGIDVDYYVGVDMNAVKDLGDAIGGVEFDLETKFNISGRIYVAGKQHMDGQGILDYMRVRKAGNIDKSLTGDQNRVDRQKKMLLAIFETMKSKDMLLRIPDILAAFDGNMFTNLSTSQFTALAVFAYNLDPESISMHSMKGSSGKIGEWNFVFTNQKNRVSVIEEVYGVTAKKYTNYTSKKATELYYEITGTFVDDRITAGLAELAALLPAAADPEACALYDQAVAAFPVFQLSRSYTDLNTLKDIVDTLAEKLGVKSSIKWYYPYDKKYNKVYVDFR